LIASPRCSDNNPRRPAWHRKNPNYFVEIPDLPNVWQTIEDIASQPWTLATLEEHEGWVSKQ
jgi:type I restriction enzyme M protein